MEGLKMTKDEKKVIEKIKKEHGGTTKRYDFWFAYNETGKLTYEGGYELPKHVNFRNDYSLMPGGKVVKNIFSTIL